MIASPFAFNLSLVAINMSQNTFLIAINVSQKFSCLRAGGFMIASRNKYLSLLSAFGSEIKKYTKKGVKRLTFPEPTLRARHSKSRRSWGNPATTRNAGLARSLASLLTPPDLNSPKPHPLIPSVWGQGLGVGWVGSS